MENPFGDRIVFFTDLAGNRAQIARYHYKGCPNGRRMAGQSRDKEPSLVRQQCLLGRLYAGHGMRQPDRQWTGPHDGLAA